MSYLVLARKYRPQTFADVVGQAPVVKTLRNSLLRRRVAHAILFSGVRGVGKTTLARIMAKAINCEGDAAERPCNTCRSCQEITGGQSLDLHEIDGASNRGIQEIRELKEKIRFLPTASQFKIFIIDEVHMLTTEAFNALLKTLEEPPAHVYFMFATTELHKIPITILSRCQRYELKRVAAAELKAHFSGIAQSEGVTVEAAALDLIVREAEGSVRDGLSLLDQMFSFGDTAISHQDVIQVLGLTDRTILLTITAALLAGDRASALKTLEDCFDYGIDIKRFTADLLECFRNLLLLKIGDCAELIDQPEEELVDLRRIAGHSTFETIHFKLDLLMKASEELRHATQPRLALETAFLKIIEAGNVVAVNTLLAKVDSLLGTLPASPPSPASPEPSDKKKIAAAAALSPLADVPGPPADEEPPPPEEPAYLGGDTIGPAPSVPAGVPKKEETPIIGTAAAKRDVRRDWMDFIDYVKQRKIWMAQDLQRADSAREKEGELQLTYSDPTVCTLLRNKENSKTLTEFVLDFFQKDLTVRFILPEGTNGSDDGDPDSPQKKRQQLANDPLVQMAVEIFNGQVGDIRIGARSR